MSFAFPSHPHKLNSNLIIFEWNQVDNNSSINKQIDDVEHYNRCTQRVMGAPVTAETRHIVWHEIWEHLNVKIRIKIKRMSISVAQTFVFLYNIFLIRCCWCCWCRCCCRVAADDEPDQIACCPEGKTCRTYSHMFAVKQQRPRAAFYEYSESERVRESCVCHRNAARQRSVERRSNAA